MLQHLNDWHSYARDVLGHDVRKDDIVLVCGWTKAAADWRAEVFSHWRTSAHVSIHANAPGVAGGEVGSTRRRNSELSEMYREGELYHQGATSHHIGLEDRKKDQCAFLQCYRTKRRGVVLPRKIVAGAGYHYLPDSEDDRSGAYGEGLVAMQDEVDGEVSPCST